MSLATLSTTALILHIQSCHLLAQRRVGIQNDESTDNRQRKDAKPRQQTLPATWLIALCGITTACILLATPLVYHSDNILNHCGLRALCFFYACKTLDLTLTRARDPPIKLSSATPDGGIRQPVPMQTTTDQWRYTWGLMTEMRYFSFDIAVDQRQREKVNKDSWTTATAYTLVLGLVLTSLVYILPIPHAKVMLLLFVIQIALETVHTLLHPHCPHALFYRPWAASSIGEFWSTHWQGCATPFLHSLAFRPAKRAVIPLMGKAGGDAVGVLAAFCLSGVWHGWAGAPLASTPWFGFQIWVVFMAMGIGCLLERWIWGARQGGTVQRVMVWVYVVSVAGWCWTSLEKHSRIAWLRGS